MIFALLASSFGADFPVEFFLKMLLPTYVMLFFLYYLIPSICLYFVFKKAGETAWVAFIPLVCYLTALEIIEKPKTWFAGLFFPMINYVVYFAIYIGLAKKFEKSTAFGVGMTILPFIFLPILAFGDARLKGHKEIFYDDDILDRG